MQPVESKSRPAVQPQTHSKAPVIKLVAVCEIGKYFWGVTNYQARRAHHTPLGGIFCHP